MTDLHLPTRAGGEQRHNPDKAFPHLAEWEPAERRAAAQQLADLLDGETDQRHVADAEVNIERAQMLLDLLMRPCECGRIPATQLGLDLGLPGVDIGSRGAQRQPVSLRSQTRSGAGRAASIDDNLAVPGGPGVPNSGTYLHNLWHLLRG